MKVPILVILDLICVCLGFGLFCLFHFVIDFSGDMSPVVLVPSESVTSTATVFSAPQSPVYTAPEISESYLENLPTEDSEVEKNTSGMFGGRFSDKFTNGEIIQTQDSYQSENINISVSHIEENGVIYNIAEIFIRDVKYFKTAFGEDSFKKHTENLTDLAKDHSAIVAISGDHYGARTNGIVVRNGVLYRSSIFEDIGILTNKGELITKSAGEYDTDMLLESAPWQVWSFGPELLDNGNIKTTFVSNVKRANPRTAIGCVEPGHYFFVEVDGRIKDSKGLTMEQLSQLFYNLGCSTAYNLDGGQTSGFYWNGQLLSYPYGRPVWDMIYIGEDE